MSEDLRLIDYEDGYRFRAKCSACGYGWYEEPRDILSREDTHMNMFLEEVEPLLRCKCCYRAEAKLTPLIVFEHIHHFVGGLP